MITLDVNFWPLSSKGKMKEKDVSKMNNVNDERDYIVESILTNYSVRIGGFEIGNDQVLSFD